MPIQSNTLIQLKRSGVYGNTPSLGDLELGELALNYNQGILYYSSGASVKKIYTANSYSTINANNSLLVATSPTSILSLTPANTVYITGDSGTNYITIGVNDNTNNVAGTLVLRDSNGDFAAGNITVRNVNSSANIIATGLLDIGLTANINGQLTVGQGSTVILPNLIAQFTGSSDLYSQINQQNLSGNGSADVVVTANNGTDLVNYTDMGMAGGSYDNTSYNAFPMVQPNDGYFLVIGNAGQNYGGNVYYGTTGSGSYSDISFIQGAGFGEVARFIEGQGLVIKKTTASTSNSTGALVVQGGIGANGAIYADNVYDQGIELLSYINTANAWLQANDTNTLTTAENYTDTVNTYNTLYTNSAIAANLATAKAYTDTANTYLDNKKVNRSGDTITGPLSITYTSAGANSLSVSGNVSFSSDLYISGNLIIGGNTTTISSNNIILQDPLIYLANDNPANIVDIGIVGSFTSDHYQHTGVVRDHSDGKWKFFSNVVPEPSSTIDFSNAIYDTLKVGTIEASVANIAGYDLLVYSQYGYSHANSAYTKANNAVQTGWTTITANGISVSPASNTDTLTFTAAAANGISIITTSNPDTIDLGLFNSGVTAGSYTYPSLTVDKFGRVTTIATQTAVSSLSSNSTGRITQSGTTGAVFIDLAASGVLAGTYTYPQLDVDSYGRVTNIINQTPVTSIAANSSSRITQNQNTGAVTFDLASSGVTPGNYTIANITVDTYGRVTSATSGNTLSIPLSITNSTASISNSTGALTVSGGIGVKGNVYSGAIYITGSSNGITFLDGSQQYVSAAPYAYSNAAFLRANSAYDSQNTTASFANASYLHANTGYANANAAYLQANAAYSQGNTTVSNLAITNAFANAAYLQANASYIAQNTTASFANSGYAHANASYIAQNTTATFANSAYLHANASYIAQNVTAGFANASYSHANASYTAQNTTATFANAAFTLANTTASNLSTNISYNQGINDLQNTNISIAQSFANGAFTRANNSVLKAGDTMTGVLNISNTTSSTSNTTGALVVSGGAGITGNVFIGGSLTVAGNTIIENTYINNSFINTADMIVVSNTTPATSNTTGAVQITGGVGVQGSIYGGTVYSNGQDVIGTALAFAIALG